ncbi:hypothetical protein LNKW23_35840 [Paralimibaculum aggregatum]|uniref:Restriction endonuclease type IV Mrr domain-containing protein n=1 Tax=Paralimibaculum aggregatum TaxID=3036245 RepID=A0ABQ6LPJ1_9RHOB|nr:restriction endonuclease [Limibaculum sp. NKW23]GMG84369.1 hypothetical protein LNKW23_35840 [Limibaculum sp. NKW23]
MKALTFLFNLAVSLFVAPTPGLLILMYANGGTTIPPVQGLVVLVISAAGYWIWLSDRRGKRTLERRVERARSATPERPADSMSGLPADTDPGLAAKLRAKEQRRKAREALRGFEDLRDPLAESRAQSPGAMLIDRVADLRQLKSLVVQNEASLLNAFARSVARDEFGAPEYGSWAYEADRFLMSSSFMARTLSRHEAIATVTAEVEFLISDSQRQTRERAALPPRPAPVLLAPPSPEEIGARQVSLGYQPSRPSSPAYMPPMPHELLDPAMSREAPAPAASSGGPRMSDGLKRRLLSRRTHGFARDCAAVLDEHGWVTQTTDSPGSDAIDIFAERGDLIVGLRCRQTGEPLDEDVLTTVIEARDRFGLDAAGIVTTAGVTTAARAAATINGICLLEEGDLADLHFFVAHRKKVVPLFKGQQAQAQA